MKKHMGYILPISTFVLWGSLYVVSKDVMSQVPPMTLLFFRYVISCAVLFPLIRIRRGELPKIQKGDRKLFLVVGFLGYGLAIALQQYGTKMLAASLAALINATNPVFICILAFLILKEKITVEQIIGIALAIAGVYVILGVSGGSSSIAGVIASLASVFFWSLSSVLVRRITGKYDPIPTTFYGMLLALIPVLPAMLVELHYTPAAITGSGIVQMLYIGIVTTCIAHILWNKGLQIMPAAVCSAFYPLQPLSSAVLGVLFLSEPVTGSFIAGTVIISCGIIIFLLHISWLHKGRAR